jgi:hypothetical protein
VLGWARQESQKSCFLGKQKQDLLDEAEQALQFGYGVNLEAVTKNLGIVQKYTPRIKSMLKAYCKGDG